MPFVAVRLQWGHRIFSSSLFVLLLACDLSFSVWDSEVIKEKKFLGFSLYILHFTHRSNYAFAVKAIKPDSSKIYQSNKYLINRLSFDVIKNTGVNIELHQM